MVSLSLSEISERIKKLVLPEFDLVVGIAEGGVVPAGLIAYKLGVELSIIKINYRDDTNKPLYEKPVILYSIEKPVNKKILIVDDVSVSGKTLNTAAELFTGNTVSTLSLKGKADYVLFPEVDECVKWPWKLYPKGEAF
ncbi:MAG: phosphoribosyltransferase [Ignavibacteriaceae bacterium]